jgi:hypothetical protein
MAERKGGNSWRCSCFCEKKIISTPFYGIKFVTLFVIQDFDTRWVDDEDLIFSSIGLEDGGQQTSKMSMSTNKNGALSEHT